MGNLSSFPNRRDWGMGYVVNESGDFGIPESNYDNLDALREGMRSAFKGPKKKIGDDEKNGEVDEDS